MRVSCKGVALFFAVVAFGLPVAPVAALDSSDAVFAARQKINVAGRQRMLSQRMTSAVCLTVTGADATLREKVAMAALADFDVALLGLKDGNADLKLTPEPNPQIRAGLRAVETTWAEFSPAAQQVMAGDLSSTAIGTILNLNLQLLGKSNDVVKLFEEVYGDEAIDPGTAVTINVAGRQRMLSQKMTKELCFIAADFDAAESREALKGTVALFDKSLEQLRFGDVNANIVTPPNAEVLVQLGVVASIWRDVKPRMEAVMTGDDVAIADLAGIAATTDEMLKEMHKAVLLYVSSSL